MRSAYGPAEASGLWVYLEVGPAGLRDVSLELLGKGRTLADERGEPLTGVLIGQGVAPLAAVAAAHGCDRVLVAEDERLGPFIVEAYTRVLYEAVLAEKPDILLLGATPQGRDIAGRLAVRLRTGLTADCTEMELDPAKRLLLCEVAGFGGGILAVIKCEDHRPQIATVRPGVFSAPPAVAGRGAQVLPVPVRLRAEDLRVRVLKVGTAAEAAVTRAPVVVVGGRGAEGHFDLLRRLAAELDGALGATRVAVDEGWASRDAQIGQTGVLVRPKLAVVCGASGALQFTVGIEHAETVVVINVDPEAPIFEQADYGVVEDVSGLLPLLVEKVAASDPGVGGQV